MTTDLEGLARVHDGQAAFFEKTAAIATAKLKVCAEHPGSLPDEIAADTERAQAHRQAAVLIRGGGEPVAHTCIASGQIEKLARFIMDNVPGEPSENEGAVDAAIRIMAAALIRSAPAPGREEIARVIAEHCGDGDAGHFESQAADAILALFHAPAEAGGGEVIEACDWPAKPFRFYDDPGKHDPCYVVMPDGAMIPLNHHAGEAVDVARAHFIVDACNAALAPEAMVRTAGAKLLTALERYGFPVSDAASTAAMSVEARDLHNAARRFKIAITSTKRAADEPAVTNGQ